MTVLYTRPGNDVTIRWEPADTEKGKVAIENVIGSEPESYPVEVDNQTAAKIRDEYDSL
jgi:hypothetical protein